MHHAIVAMHHRTKMETTIAHAGQNQISNFLVMKPGAREHIYRRRNSFPVAEPIGSVLHFFVIISSSRTFRVEHLDSICS